jgi:hypothetical protein
VTEKGLCLEVIVLSPREIDLILCAIVRQLLQCLKDVIILCEVVALVGGFDTRTLMKESLHLFEVSWAEVRRKI